MSRQKIVLLACGSFNPPHFLHARIFEIAKNYLRSQKIDSVQGWLSPVSDGYGKPGLVSSHHRVEMCCLLTSTSDWLSVSTWESENPKWTPTVLSVEYHADKAKTELNAGLRLLVGADFLESFSVPGLWADDDVERIAKIGIIAISRNGIDSTAVLDGHPVLKNHKGNILLIKDEIQNNISSTTIRASLRNGDSIRYLTTCNVADYLIQNDLYNEESEKKERVLYNVKVFVKKES